MIKFGTSGFRAIIGDGFTKENVQKIAYSLAKMIKKNKSEKPVVVGFDRRFMSDQAAVWFTEVLAANKIHTQLYTKPVPSPTVMFTVMNDNLDYGVIITASHNPHQYNGIKIVIKGGADANNEVVAEIEKVANAVKRVKTMNIEDAKQAGIVTDIDNMKDYFKNLSKFVSKNIKNNKLKVLFNAMHGACSDYAKDFGKMYKIAKFDVINSSDDPYFEHKLPAPEDYNLDDFKKAVVKGKYHIGVAVDGDGDRLGVVDENGTYHDNNILMAIAYYYLIKYRGMKGDVVKNNPTSIIMDKLAETFGFKCHEVPVGFKYTSVKMKETDALLGGESSGGMSMRNYIPSKDSFFSISLILDAMVNIGKPFSEIIAEVKEACGYISTYVTDGIHVKNKKKLQKVIKSNKMPNFSYKAKSKPLSDGIKYTFEDGSWCILRFSGTEDLLRYYMEFPTEIECERNTKAIMNFIAKYGSK